MPPVGRFFIIIAQFIRSCKRNELFQKCIYRSVFLYLFVCILTPEKSQEVLIMKATAIRPSRYVSYRRNTYTPYPNAAQGKGALSRLLDALLAAAITIALAVIVLFLLARA